MKELAEAYPTRRATDSTGNPSARNGNAACIRRAAAYASGRAACDNYPCPNRRTYRRCHGVSTACRS